MPPAKKQKTSGTVTLGDYLFTRLKQLEVTSIFGVPGDFNLALLDHVYNVEGVKWVGNTNELNAGYAADGYSRIKRLAAIITTFGVGELSALAAIAGSYAEHVGLVHIVGVPSLSSQNKQLLLHHTLGNGDFTVFRRMSENISHSSIVLDDRNKVASQIDLAIRNAYVNQRPVYLAIPANFSEVPIEAELLDTPIDLSIPKNDPQAEQEVLDQAVEMMKAAKKPVILVDACAARHDCIQETIELAQKTQYPVFVTPMGKSVFDEHNPRFGGVYVGSLSNSDVLEIVENADLIISVGGLLSDFNTGSFTYHYSTRNIIEFHSDHTKIRSASYANIRMKELMNKVNDAIPQASVKAAVPVPSVKTTLTPVPPQNKLTQKWLWTRVGQWLRPGDIVITETGTSSFGIVQTKFPKKTVGISQVLWGSIGYSVGAAMGAAIAADEIDPERRVILFVGDGSLQLTVTEISSMIRHGLKPYLFVLNNNGYTIERLIHGLKAGYNDIQPWKHTSILETFGAKDFENHVTATTGELDGLYNDKAFSTPSKIRLVEIMLDELDAPEALVRQAEVTAKTNAVGE